MQQPVGLQLFRLHELNRLREILRLNHNQPHNLLPREGLPREYQKGQVILGPKIGFLY